MIFALIRVNVELIEITFLLLEIEEYFDSSFL